jgi:hypothetical protein
MRMMWNSLSHQQKVCFLSTYVPRKCGIAVFTKDLVENLDLTGDFAPATVIAVKKRVLLRIMERGLKVK